MNENSPKSAGISPSFEVANIRGRRVFEGLEITTENIRPIAEMWVDGEVRETDNLQISMRSISEKPIYDVMGFLYYFDSNGREVGHDFDLINETLRHGENAHLSFLLQPPAEMVYAELEIKAEYKESDDSGGLRLLPIVLIVLAICYAYLSK